MTQPQPRKTIAAMPKYVPGARNPQGGRLPIKLSSNETPFAPFAEISAAAAAAAATSNRYADMFSVELTEALAARHAVAPAQIAVSAGSVAVLGHILQAYCEAGDEVVFPWRSFEAYPIITAVAGAVPVTVPLAEGARHDLSAMAAAVTDRTRVVFVCTPNNPTGPAIRSAEFAELMKAIPERVLVVVDEAYVEFVRDPKSIDGRALIDAHANVVVTRTFSKAYGLAGLRVGYALGAEQLIAPVRACVTPFSVSAVAQAAALAALSVEQRVLERVAEVVGERDRVRSALLADRWSVPEAQGNFVWLPVADASTRAAEHLAASDPAILVRPFGGEGVRISIGSREENEQLLARLATYPDRF